MGSEAAFGGDAVVIDHAQRAEAHVVGVVVLAEREGVAAVEPAELAVEAVIGAADGQLGVGCRLHALIYDQPAFPANALMVG